MRERTVKLFSDFTRRDHIAVWFKLWVFALKEGLWKHPIAAVRSFFRIFYYRRTGERKST